MQTTSKFDNESKKTDLQENLIIAKLSLIDEVLKYAKAKDVRNFKDTDLTEILKSHDMEVSDLTELLEDILENFEKRFPSLERDDYIPNMHKYEQN